jgi:quercetin dioxygenase-like cupin family protein
MSEDKKDRFGTPFLLKRYAQNKINWSIPMADREGFKRGMHNGVQAQKGFAKLVTIPFGQRTPVHSTTSEHIIFMVRGQVEFTIDEKTYRLDEEDLFFFPADAPYSFLNAGTGDALFLSVNLEAGGVWPPGSTYWVDGEKISYST